MLTTFIRRCAAVLLPGLVLALAIVGSALAAADANRAPCSNAGLPGFRSHLPDCRAYELVTPPYTAGYYFTPALVVNGVGAELLGESLGNVGEEAPKVMDNPGRPDRILRTAAGWMTEPLLSSSAFAALQRPGKSVWRAMFRYLDTVSGTSLWDVFYGAPDGVGEPEDILEIEKPDGAVVEVGPARPGGVKWTEGSAAAPGSSAAASARMEHIVVATNANGAQEKWPGDSTQTGAGSLYEYPGGAQREPTLVAVKNQHRLHSNAEAELISNCSTELGGAGDMYNALASNGATVFFSVQEGEPQCSGPPVRELYARVNSERTVAISEPSHEDCEECNTATGLGEPKFQGASADGSRVYFLTAQELLPGATGNNLYEYAFDAPKGRKVTLVSRGPAEAQAQGVVRVSSDGSRVYFVAAGKLTGANAEGKEPTAGADNLYVFEQDAEVPNGRLSYIATLANGDESDWYPQDLSRPAAVTPDGRYLVFTSAADLTADDTSTDQQLFEYDAKEQTLHRLSVGQRSLEHPGGYNNNGNTTEEFDGVTVATANYSYPNAASGQAALTVSDDGTSVFFQSGLGLTAEAVNNLRVGPHCILGLENEAGECTFGEQSLYAQNVYEYHWSGHVGEGNVYLISDGRDASAFGEGQAVHLIGTDHSGGDVFFTTTQRLLPQVADSQQNIYDARVDGGFSAPAQAAECAASSCERPITAAPQLSSPGSSSWPGGENLQAQTPGAQPRPRSGPSREQRLLRALRACRRRPKGKRHGCEAAARRRFGTRANKRARSHR